MRPNTAAVALLFAPLLVAASPDIDLNAVNSAVQNGINNINQVATGINGAGGDLKAIATSAAAQASAALKSLTTNPAVLSSVEDELAKLSASAAGLYSGGQNILTSATGAAGSIASAAGSAASAAASGASNAASSVASQATGAAGNGAAGLGVQAGGVVLGAGAAALWLL